MSLLNAALHKALLWRAFLHLGSTQNAERAYAMKTLTTLGEESLPSLRAALCLNGSPRAQFAAVVVLHRLGQREGISTLIEATQWRLPSAPEITADLEEAWLAVGSPDAAPGLLTVWGKLTDWNETNPVVALICRVWAVLRDPCVLDALIQRSALIPARFEETVVAFGELALPHLENLTQNAAPDLRLLAVRAVQRIFGGRSFEILVPLLCDPEPQVRALIPAALVTTGGGLQAVRQITNALEAGYSTPEAIALLTKMGPTPYQALLDLVARWNPASRVPSGDTEASALAAIRTLEIANWPNFLVAPTLIQLINRKPGPALTAEAARVLGIRAGKEFGQKEPAHELLLTLLPHPDDAVRNQAADALTRLQEKLGFELMNLLSECRPHGSLITRFQAILRGGPEAGQAANLAVEQVMSWVSRFSRDMTGQTGSPNNPAAPQMLHDPRLPALLRDLLCNTLDALNRAVTPPEIETLLKLSLTVLRALSRIGNPAALVARDAIVSAFHLVKRGSLLDTPLGNTFRPVEIREIGQIVRAEAMETLLTLYGNDCFGLFFEALYAPDLAVRATAVAALGRLGDARALSHLQPMASDGSHLLNDAAIHAVAAIKRVNPDVMTLLRASSGSDARPETLLRPASGNNRDTAPDQLLRPSENK